MHHNHTTRPQHIRHHIGHHQGPMHHQPPVGMNMGPQIGPPPPPPQHHMPNMQPPPHGANQPIRQYIPPNQRGDMTRFSHHNQPRLQQPMHQPSLQSKLRTSSSHHNGLLATSIPPPTSQQQQQQQQQQQLQQQQQQQQHMQQKNYQQQAAINHQPNLSKHQTPPKHHVPSIQNKLGLVQKKSLPQHLSHPPPPLVHSKPPPLPTKQQLSKQPVQQQQQQPTSTTSKHVTIHSQHNPSHHAIPQQLPLPHQQHAASPPTSNSVAPTSPGNQALQLQSIQRQQNLQQQKQQQQLQSVSVPSPQTPISPTSPGNQSHQLQNVQRQQSLQQQQQQPQGTTHQPIAAVTQKQSASQQQSQNKSAQLQSQNISKQTTISSTTNSVLVSITHQQIQQTQQTVVVQQQTRRGQSLDNQTTNAQISQSSPTNNNNNLNTSNNSPNEKSPELMRGIALPSTTNETLANSKEKTPMCLVNELARYNKIQHQYRLTGEQGPAHSKRFTVTLRLGEEEYTSDGLSIKKAQHSAAADAISKTKYQHPPAKSNRLKSGIKPGLGNITPTVELNALAMKLGEPTLYLLDNNQPAGDGTVRSNSTAPPAPAGQHQTIMPAQAGVAGIPPQSNQYSMPLHQNYFAENQFTNFHRAANPPNGTYNSQRFPGYARRPFVKGPLKFNTNQQRMIPYNNLAVNGAPREPCRITLVVGMRKFVGVGGTLQAARHDAATRALEVLKPLVNDDAPESSNESTDDANSDLKSPISLVHEIALKRNMIVTFDVTSEIGPPHMKTFLTICKVGNIVTEGEGNGKKISKKRAAENMLEELRKLPPVSPSRVIQTITKLKNFANKRKPQPIKRKTRNIIKDQSEPEYSEEVNPISKLIQIQQALKEREPTYTVVEERGAPRRREFVIEVSVSGHTARGTGTNKKMAKRLAAENLLSLLGFTTPTSNGTKDPNANKLITNNNNVESSSEKNVQHVKFQDSVDINALDMNESSHQARQIGSSTHLMQQKPLNSALKAPTVNGPKNDCSESNVTTTSTVASNKEKNSFTGDGVRPKDQLLYLGQLLGFQVQYSDYPKGNHGAYLSIVTLTTDPPQLCHGAGNKIEESQDEASLTALKLLSELGLDNVKPKKSNNPEEIKA